MKKRRKSAASLLFLMFLGAALGLAAFFLISRTAMGKGPKEILAEYIDCISQKKYKEMYSMIDQEASGGIAEAAFIERYANIYEGIEAKNIQLDILEADDRDGELTYSCAFDTLAGTVRFENRAHFIKKDFRYKLVWTDSMIFPELEPEDKVQASVQEAKRGEILDRNGMLLAGEGTAASVGLVPGKMENAEETAGRLCALLGMEKEDILTKLSAQWVKEDSFVPIKTIPKVEELDLLAVNADGSAAKEQRRQEELLEIPGVMITDMQVRSYPLEEAAAHLIGYVQAVTAEDLEEHAGEGYTANSVIGRSGMEGLFEKELKGKDGCRVVILSPDGSEKKIIAQSPVENGKTVRLTIDGELQRILYERFKEDKSCSVALHPYSGETLALVSTPSYDNNAFILGMSGEMWDSLNQDEKRPLYNRFRQAWCPGSTFKPIVAAIGLDVGAIDPLEDYGNEGLSWQKDDSWGSYYVTTLQAYDPVIMENAIMYSDNIYFAKAALKIGAEKFAKSLKSLGFDSQMPYEIQMPVSQYSNAEQIESEVQLADSGYGQGQILVNPLHLAALYTAFCNGGDALQPYLVYREEKKPETWIPQAFSGESAEKALHAMNRVVNDAQGTGYKAHREDVPLAGKTGTAEIKESKEDTEGTELGWFAVFTADPSVEKPVLLVSMAEDVKEIGGSGYVIEKDKAALEEYWKK